MLKHLAIVKTKRRKGKEERRGDRLAETEMVNLVICENGKATDITTTTNRYLHSYTKQEIL